MAHRHQSRIKGDKCVEPKYFCDERRVADERKFLTTVQPQPVKIMLFNARSIDHSTHTMGEHSACVKVRN